MLTAAAWFVLMFIAALVSAGAFTLLIEEVLGYFFGQHSMVVLFSLGAVVGTINPPDHAVRELATEHADDATFLLTT